jgi:hypothetical protein
MRSETATVTVFAKISVDVPARLSDAAQHILESHIEHSSLRDGIHEAFAADGVPMKIDTLHALSPDEVFCLDGGEVDAALAKLDALIELTHQSVERVQAAGSAPYAGYEIVAPLERFLASCDSAVHGAPPVSDPSFDTARVTVFAKISVDVPARLSDAAQHILESHIEHSSLRDGIHEAFGADRVPMEIDTLRALDSGEAIFVVGGRIDNALHDLDALAGVARDAVERVRIASSSPFAIEVAIGPLTRFVAKIEPPGLLRAGTDTKTGLQLRSDLDAGAAVPDSPTSIATLTDRDLVEALLEALGEAELTDGAPIPAPGPDDTGTVEL